MNQTEITKRLLAVGEKIKAKGWASASIDIGAHYLAIFDREPGPDDPMIYYSPSIRASTRDRHGIPTTHDFVNGVWGVKTLLEAMEKLEEAADKMPRMSEEADRLAAAKAKLSDDELRLLRGR